MRHLTIRKQLIGFAFAGITVAVALGIAAQGGLFALKSNVDSLIASQAVVQNQMQADMMHDAIRADIQSLQMANGDTAQLKVAQNDLSEHIQTLKEAFESNQKAAISPGLLAHMQSVSGALQQYTSLAASISVLYGAGKAPEANQLNQFKQAFTALEGQMEGLSDQIVKEAQSLEAAADQSFQQAAWTLGLIAVAGSLIFLIIARLVIRNVTRPLDVLKNTALGVVNTGNLRLRASHDRGDEFGQTVTAFNQLMDTLSTIVSQTQQAVAAIQRSSSELQQTSHTVQKNSASQSDAAMSMAAGVEELSNSLSVVTQSNQETQQLAHRAGMQSIAGSKIVGDAANHISDLVNAIRTTASHLITLNDNARQIGDVVNMIKEVADQTNLLALNASIEAARAGEQGRGFAVVADEVRKLAERTTNSTQQIVEVISTIRQTVIRTTDDMTANVGQVESVADIAKQAGQAVGDIQQLTNEAEVRVTDISHALQEESTASILLATSVEKVANLAQETAQMITRADQEIAELNQLATQLHSSLGRFSA